MVSSYPRFIIFSCQKFRYCALSLLKIQSKLSLTGQCLKTSASKSGVAATWLAAMQTGFWVEEAHIDAICTAKKSQLRLTEYHPGARPPWSPCRHWLSSSLSIPCLLVPTSQIWGVFVVPTACIEEAPVAHRPDPGQLRWVQNISSLGRSPTCPWPSHQVSAWWVQPSRNLLAP